MHCLVGRHCAIFLYPGALSMPHEDSILCLWCQEQLVV